LKAAEPTRCPDTSSAHGTGELPCPSMKKLLLLAVLVALGLVAARKLKVD
jgi:hypothetical protein